MVTVPGALTPVVAVMPKPCQVAICAGRRVYRILLRQAEPLPWSFTTPPEWTRCFQLQTCIARRSGRQVARVRVVRAHQGELDP